MRKHTRIDALYTLRFLRLTSALLLLGSAAITHAGSNGVRDSDAARISVTAVAGAVDVTMAGTPTSVAPDTTVLLPARVVTGSDGNLGLTQAGTHVNVASDSDVEIPAEAVDGNLIARLVQHRGNVFYDVAPRDLGKLRVETPLLVAVIKGTQFNVAVQEDSTTISLFEGRLEIRTPDDSQVVQLNAGEIAIRSRVDSSIRVVGMNDERIAAPATRPDVADAADARVDLDADGARAGLVPLGVELANDAVFSAGTEALEASIGVKPTLDVDGAGVQVEIAGSDVDLGIEAGVDLGAAAVDLGLDAGVDLGAAAVDLALDSAVDLGAATVDLELDAGVDLGGTVVDTGLDASLDLGDGLDLGLETEVVVADIVDTSLDAGLTLDTGTPDLGLDAGLDLGGVLDVGLELDVGGGDVDLSLDLGGGGDAAAPPDGGLGGLLGGLL